MLKIDKCLHNYKMKNYKKQDIFEMTTFIRLRYCNIFQAVIQTQTTKIALILWSTCFGKNNLTLQPFLKTHRYGKASKTIFQIDNWIFHCTMPINIVIKITYNDLYRLFWKLNIRRICHRKRWKNLTMLAFKCFWEIFNLANF